MNSWPTTYRILLRSLDDAEKAVADARRVLDEAEIRYDLECAKFAAIRDEVSTYLPDSPYLYGTAFWGEERPERGKFRFLRMPAAEAVMLALRQGGGGSMTPGEILAVVNENGGSLDMRSLNAALQGLVTQQNIAKYERSDGHTEFGVPPEEVDPDDLPF